MGNKNRKKRVYGKKNVMELKKKIMGVVGRAENSGERQSFRSHTTHKGRPRAGMPQNSSPTFSHPEMTCKEQKQWKKWEGTENPDETPAKPNHTRSTLKPLFYTTKVIPKPFTHIRSRFLFESFMLNTVGKEDGTSDFRTSPDSGVWGPYKRNLYQKWS